MSTPGGKMSESEAVLQWEEWKQNPNHPSGFDGPRKHLRLLVPCKKRVVDYSNLAHERELEREQKLGKNTGEAALDKKMGLLFMNGEHESFSSWGDALGRAERSSDGSLQNLLDADIKSLLRGAECQAVPAGQQGDEGLQGQHAR